MAKFKLFWENNPETPLNAERLSSFIDHYSYESIIYSDDDLFLPNGDGKLKIRDLVKVNHISQNTLAAFSFNGSLTSYNSKFAPIAQRDIIFREEHYDRKGAVAFDESITNLITNPGFEEDGTDWTFFRGSNLNEDENTSIDSIIEYTTEDYHPILNVDNLKSAKITTGTYNGTSRLIKYISAEENANISLSFYYKAESDCLFHIKSGSIESPEYYNNLAGWQPSERRYALPATNEWTRFELPDIPILDKLNVRLEINIVETESVYYFDSFLVEDKPYCSSYYHRDTDSTILSYSKDVINYEKGLIDFIFLPKYKGNSNTFFTLKTGNPNNDALRLEYDGINGEFIVRVYDTYNSAYVENRAVFNYDAIINEWNRCVLNWDLSEKRIQLAIVNLPMEGDTEEFSVDEGNIFEFILPEDILLFDEDDITQLCIGSNGGNDSARSIIEFFKINKENKSQEQLLRDLNLLYSFIDKPSFKMFESPYYSLEITEDMLDENSFEPNTRYYLWLGDNEDSDSCDILVSTSSHNPKGYKWFNSSLIGGFHTNDDDNIDISSFWDRSTNPTNIFHTDRLLIGNTRTRTIDDTSNESSQTPIEFKTYPEKDATFNLDTYFTKHVYGRNRNDGNFLDINNASGEMFLDNLHFDGYTIDSINSNLEITALSNTLDLHSNEVKITSEGTNIKLDDLRILDNKIYSKSGSKLFIDTKEDGNNDFQINTDEFDIDTGRTDLNSTLDVHIVTGTDVLIEAGKNFTVSSGIQSEDVINLDDLTIKNNVLYRDETFQLKSNTSYVEIESLRFNDNKLFYKDENKRFIRFYEDATDSTLENIDIASDNLIKIDSPKFEVTANQITFHADMANYFRLEDLRVDGNKLFTSDTDLRLGGSGDEQSPNVYVRSQNNIYLNSQHIEFAASTIDLNLADAITFDNLRINDNTFDSIDGQMNIGNSSYKTYITGVDIEIDDVNGKTFFPTDIQVDGTIFGNATTATNFKIPVDLVLEASEVDTAFNTVTKTLSGTEETITFDISHIHDNRYYTETESDSRFVNTTSDSMSGSLSIGDTLTVGNITGEESTFQSSSPTLNGDGYIQTPWIYTTGGIEADERGGAGTGIFFNDGYHSSSTDTINIVTNGSKRLTINSNGRVNIAESLNIGNSGAFVSGDVTPSNDGYITLNGDFKAYRVYNAVWMDLAECWDKNKNYDFYYGMTVVQTKDGIKPSEKRAEKGTVGVISNTYGYILGSKDFNEEDFNGSKSLPIAISGRVIAYYAGKLEIGDEVVSTKQATLTRANLIEKIIKRDRLIGRVDEVIDDKKCRIKVY